jgi:hypothetical protein
VLAYVEQGVGSTNIIFVSIVVVAAQPLIQRVQMVMHGRRWFLEGASDVLQVAPLKSPGPLQVLGNTDKEYHDGG